MDSLEDLRLLVRDKGLLSTHSSTTSLGYQHLYQFPKSHFPQAMWIGTDVTCTLSGLHYSKGSLSFGNLALLECAVSIPILCSRESCYCSRQVVSVFIAPEGDTISCHLLWENAVSLTSKAAFYTKILKEIILNKTKPLSCS